MHNEHQLAVWRQQWRIGHYLLLGTVIATAVNILLLLTNMGFFIPYCGAVPYYLTYFGFYFDFYQIGTYTVTGMVMAFVCLAVYLFLWWRAKYRTGWMIAGLVLLIMDTLALALIALVFVENPASCLLEFIFHIVVIYEVIVGIRAKRRLDTPIEGASFIPEDWDSSTPAEYEYSDTL